MLTIITLLALILGCAFGASIEPKLVGGSVAGNGQFPHQVSLKDPANNNHLCGASIVSMQWILTAAHCVAGRQTTGVVALAGTNLLNSGGATYSFSSFVINSGYNQQTKANDIALLKVNGNITYADFVRPIHLATAPVPGGRHFVLSGWGVTSEGATAYSNELQYMELTSITIADCKQRLAGKPVYDSHQCTLVPNGQGACYGDDGSPLLYGIQQVGVVSWGIPCGKGSPDVFTSVAYFSSWIKSITGL